MAVDVAGLKAGISIAEVVGRYVELKRNGKEFKGLCPFHPDRRPSLAVVPGKGMFYCHGCGVGGDAIKFVQRIEGVGFEKAAEILGSGPSADRQRIAYPAVMPAEIARKCFAPPAEQVGPPDMRVPPNTDPPHPWKLAKTWTYHGTRREVLFYVGRYEWWDAGGELWKSYRAFTFADDGWRCKHWQTPRPLYNLHNLTHQPTLPVCLVEGEKAADAAGSLGGGRWVASTWPGGAHAVGKADFSPLQGRAVFIWPDADRAGSEAVDELLQRLDGIASEIHVINVSDCAQKWDAANALEEDGWDTDHLENWLTQIVAGAPRVLKHVGAAGAEPKRAGLIAPLPPPDPTAETPERLSPRGNYDLEASARHWDKAKWRPHLIIVLGKNGGKDVAPKCVENATIPLTYDDAWKGLLAWDELRQRVTATRPTPWGEQPEEWSDHHDTALQCWFDRARLFYGGLIKEAVNLVAHRNSFHPVRDYLHSIKWDGTPRLDLWLTTYCGAASNPLTNFVGKAWMISAVARAMRPGATVKTCLILFGVQDAGKSEVFRILGSPWYAVQNGTIGGDSTKAIEQCSKTWIIEMAELAKLKRTDDIEGIKAFISTYEDTYRPAYARRVQTIPRCCVFCGTSNSNEVLADTTGNVRFWPVKVYDEIDLVGLRADRDQLWAEAVARYNAGDKWWIEDKSMRSIAAEATQDFLVRDEWSTVIREWIDQPENRFRPFFTSAEILTGALKLEVGKFGKSEQGRVSSCMRNLHFEYGTYNYTREELALRSEDAPKKVKSWLRREE